MKKILPAIAFGLLILSTSVAQSEVPETTTYPTPKWVSEKGFWVVETNTHTPGRNIIYFYNTHLKRQGSAFCKHHFFHGLVLIIKRRIIKL